MNVTMNLILVLNRIIQTCIKDRDSAEMYATCLDEMLNDLNQNDAFGTEGQNDPRGDGRNGDWLITMKIEEN